LLNSSLSTGKIKPTVNSHEKDAPFVKKKLVLKKAKKFFLSHFFLFLPLEFSEFNKDTFFFFGK